jgi:superfamily I DNA and RNA helicase
MTNLRCLALLAAIWAAGCSINHPIARDYPRHLAEAAPTTLPKVPVEATYRIDEATRSHRYQFRAASVGYAHVWIVEFGKILEQTLRSEDIQGAFKSLGAEAAAARGVELDFRLVDYRFENFAAHISLEIKASRDGKVLLQNVYQATGANKAGQMLMAGVFAMKNAVNTSTKSALDDIFTRFLAELNGKLAGSG